MKSWLLLVAKLATSEQAHLVEKLGQLVPLFYMSVFKYSRQIVGHFHGQPVTVRCHMQNVSQVGTQTRHFVAICDKVKPIRSLPDKLSGSPPVQHILRIFFANPSQLGMVFLLEYSCDLFRVKAEILAGISLVGLPDLANAFEDRAVGLVSYQLGDLLQGPPFQP